MKKFHYLLPVCALFVFTSVASESSLQDELAEQLKDDHSVILIRNDTLQPVQIHDGQIGKTLLCFSADLKTFALYQVRKDMFKSGQSSALARCRDRQIFISKGYVWHIQKEKPPRNSRRPLFLFCYLAILMFERTLSWVLRCLSSLGRRISSSPCFSWASASSITTSSGRTRVRVKLPQKSSRWK